jgi:acyl-CoA thioesterase-1
MRWRAMALALLIGGTACQAEREDRVRYVALGDSYTIGTSVSEAERWPNQLTARMPELELVGNTAVNGYTSADLIDRELPQLEELRPELVTVLIGVNDVVQGVPENVYRVNVRVILDRLLELVGADRVVCVATPDYTRTPRGAEFGDPGRQREGIERINAVLREECEARGMAFVPEIFEISRRASDDFDLVAPDGLHPSGEQYRRWVESIQPVVRRLLASDPVAPAD